MGFRMSARTVQFEGGSEHSPFRAVSLPRCFGTYLAISMSLLPLSVAEGNDIVNTCPEIPIEAFVDTLDNYVEVDLSKSGDSIVFPDQNYSFKLSSGQKLCLSGNTNSPNFVVEHLFILQSEEIFQFFVWNKTKSEAQKLTESWFVPSNGPDSDLIIIELDDGRVAVINVARGK